MELVAQVAIVLRGWQKSAWDTSCLPETVQARHQVNYVITELLAQVESGLRVAGKHLRRQAACLEQRRRDTGTKDKILVD
jgi:hypothetical protein